MTRRYFALVLGVALVVAFLVPSAGAWEAIYTRPHKVAGTDRAIRVIYKEDQNGKVTQLTDTKFDNGSATWSPDGTEIVFASERNGFEEIFVMDSDGRNVRSLGFDGEYPTISEHYVTFTARLGNRDKLRVIRRDGIGVPVDIGLVGEFGSISPNEERVAFWDGSGDLILANIDGSGARRLTPGNHPSFLDDNTIVYQLDKKIPGEIYVYDLKTDMKKLVAVGVAPSVIDGSGWIVFAKGGWFAIRPDGSQLTLIDSDWGKSNFRVSGNFPNPQPVEPQGKVASIWADLKTVR